MSRPSTCSTLGLSRKLSAVTESYDGDTESLTCPGSQMENNRVNFNFNGSLTSPTFPATAREARKLGNNICFTNVSPSTSGESETETETWTSSTSVMNYTDSEFCRVKRPTGKLAESAEISQSNEGCFSNLETAILGNSKSTVDDLSTLLYRDFTLQSNEISHSSFNDHICSETNRASESSLGRFVFSDNSMAINNGPRINPGENSGQQRETELEIKEKKRALRNNLREIVKEARKILRQTRAKRYRTDASSGRKITSGKQSERAKINIASAISLQSDTFLKNSSKVKNVRRGKRTQGSPRDSNLLKQRKKQECFDIEKIQVKHLITELTYLNLNEQAADVKRALTFTEEKEKEYDIQLEQERQIAKSRKTAEKLHQKQEAKMQRLEQIRRTEAERKEKEDIDRQRRVEEAKKRREHNRMLWESYHSAVLANSVSKSFTFSYFPKLRPQLAERPQTEPQKRTHSAKHQEAHRHDRRK